MNELDVRKQAFAMPLTSPAYPPGPYRFADREYMIITYRTDPVKLRALVPEPLELDETNPLVKYEFIRMPDSTGFGDYTESGQVIPASFRGRKGAYTHCMFLNDEPPIAGGREIWGFPKKLASPTLHTEVDALVAAVSTKAIQKSAVRDTFIGIRRPRPPHAHPEDQCANFIAHAEAYQLCYGVPCSGVTGALYVAAHIVSEPLM